MLDPHRWRKPKQWRRMVPETGALEQPMMFAIHICIAVLLMIKIAMVALVDTPFVVASTDTFTDMFLAGVQRRGDVGFLYEINGCVESVNRTIQVYYRLPAVALDVYDALSAPVQINVLQFVENPSKALPRANRPKTKKSPKSRTLDTTAWSVNITGPQDEWLGRVGIASLKEQRAFFNSLVQMELVFVLRTLHRELDHIQAFDWGITVLYDFASRGGRIEVSLSVDGSHVHGDKKVHWEIVLDLFLGLLTILSELFAYLRGRSLLGYFTQGKPQQAGTTYRWRVVTTLGNCASLLTILIEFGELLAWSREARDVSKYISGVACVLAWTKLIEHLEPVAPYNTLILAMRRGVPVVARFIIGSLPLLLGFAGLGMALFSEHSEKFAGLENSLVTLFSVLNGDVLLETARDIRKAGAVGDIYLVTFVCIFVYSGLNVFISIIQDAYATAKEQTGGMHQKIASSKSMTHAFSETDLAHSPHRVPPTELNVLSEKDLTTRLVELETQMQRLLDMQASLLKALGPKDTKGGIAMSPLSRVQQVGEEEAFRLSQTTRTRSLGKDAIKLDISGSPERQVEGAARKSPNNRRQKLQ